MSLTVAEILAMDPLRSAKPEVVAGASHLDRPVRWVHISEQPDVAGFLKGGELLLLTGIGLGEDPASQARFADELADVGAAALVVRLGAALTACPRRWLSAPRPGGCR